MADPNTTRKHEFLPWNGDDCLCKFCGQSIASISEGELCPAPETASAKPQTTTLRAEPDADWNAIWSAMQELGAVMAPLMELASPPSWAITLRFAMDVALPDVEEHCAEDESDDDQS